MAREAANTRRLMGRGAQILSGVAIIAIAIISLAWYSWRQYFHPVREGRVGIGSTSFGTGTDALLESPQWHGSRAGFDQVANVAVVGRVERFYVSYDQSEEPTMRIRVTHVLHDSRSPQLVVLTFPAQLVERAGSRWRLNYSRLERRFSPGTRVLVGVSKTGHVIELGSLTAPATPLERTTGDR